jgi:hypothetical protein
MPVHQISASSTRIELKAGEELAVILNNLGGTSKLEANFQSWMLSFFAGSGSV